MPEKKNIVQNFQDYTVAEKMVNTPMKIGSLWESKTYLKDPASLLNWYYVCWVGHKNHPLKSGVRMLEGVHLFLTNFQREVFIGDCAY